MRSGPRDFQEGLAAVRVKGRFGFVDRTGAWVIEPRFELTYGFEGGLAEVWMEDKRGYIDRKGRMVWQSA